MDALQVPSRICQTYAWKELGKKIILSQGGKSKMFNLTFMNKLTRIEWVSEWVSDRVPFECLQKPTAWLRHHEKGYVFCIRWRWVRLFQNSFQVSLQRSISIAFNFVQKLYKANFFCFNEKLPMRKQWNTFGKNTSAFTDWQYARRVLPKHNKQQPSKERVDRTLEK